VADEPKVTETGSEEIGSYAKISFLKRTVRTKAFSLFVLLLVMIVVYTILAPLRNNGFQAFFRMSAFWRILQDLAVPGLLTIGVGLLIVSGNIDLSAAGTGSLTGIIVSVCIGWYNIHWLVAILIGIVAGAIVGCLNAFLINELKQAPFIATMAMATILTAVSQIVSTDAVGTIVGTIHYNNKIVAQIGTYKLFGEVPAASLVMIILFVIYGLILSKTKFGRTLYLIGGNRSATYLAGINPRKITYFLYINCAVLASLAGVVNVSRVRMGSTTALSLYQFTGISAAIIGGISFGGGSGGLGGAFLGLLVINTFTMGLTTSGGSPYLSAAMPGTLLLVAMTFDYFNIRAQKKRVGA